MDTATDETSVHHLRKRIDFIGELKSLMGPAYMHLDLFTLFWLFIIGSIVGLGVETLFHAIVYGGYESRAGLVWGPFSPIYGVGACLLTIALNRFYYTHNIVIFLVAMVVGSVLEYATSWMMEVAWGAIAWDYTGTFGSIGGRTNFVFGIMWGTLGLVWVRLILRVLRAGFERVDFKNRIIRICTVALMCFMVVNIVVTCLALTREQTRKSGIPPATVIEQKMDEWFPDEWCEARFQNMDIEGNGVINHDNAPGEVGDDTFRLM